MRIMLLLWPILLICMLPPKNYAYPINNELADSTSYEERLKEGLDAFYRSQWTQARSVFQKLKKDYPGDSRAYFFNAMIPFWKYYFGGNQQKVADEFLEQSEAVIEISKNQLAENPSDTTMILMLSGLYGYRSLVAASEKKYRLALQSGMTGYKYTRQLLSLDSDDPKALVGKGMFYYMVGGVPNGLKWMTNAAGISADMQQGFEALEKAAQSDSYVSNDARMILAYLYERENRNEKALSHLTELTRRYPENIIFQYNQARLLEKRNQLAEAREKYRFVIGMESRDMVQLKQKSRDRLEHL